MDLDNYKPSMISVSIPSDFEIEVSDYHEFKNIQYIIKNSLGLLYNFEQVGCDGRYHAVFWMGEKPIELIEEVKKTFEAE